PGADRKNLALRLEIGERAIAARIELAERARDALLRALMPGIEIVNEQGLDAVEPEPGKAHLITLADAGGGVGEAWLERQAADPAGMLVAVGIGRADVHASDLGRDHEALARLGAQHMAEAQLALAVAVPGRGVEVADAGRMRGFECGGRLSLGPNLA